jgi:hypothetical protein
MRQLTDNSPDSLHQLLPYSAESPRSQFALERSMTPERLKKLLNCYVRWSSSIEDTCRFLDFASWTDVEVTRKEN